MKPIEVQKENICDLNIMNLTEIVDDEDKVMRKIKLNRGLVLGNAHKRKVKIYFFDSEQNPLFVETTIWAVTESNVILKGGQRIPVESIYKVSLF
tara:strand:+ start:443 stop:727 length:285 start_codon:yes stop_codon:yes gene_type:complete